MLKVGDKIKIIDYGLFSIHPDIREEYYVISEVEDYGFEKYYFKVDNHGSIYSQGFTEENIGTYVEKIED